MLCMSDSTTWLSTTYSNGGEWSSSCSGSCAFGEIGSSTHGMGGYFAHGGKENCPCLQPDLLWLMMSWHYFSVVYNLQSVKCLYALFNLLDIGSPEGISIDWVSRNIYWTDSTKDTLEVANLDNKLRKVIISEGLVNPRGVAVHPAKG